MSSIFLKDWSALMQRKQSYFDDFQFIICEINRIRQLIHARNTKALNRWDWLCSLPHPGGTGHLLIGRAAENRFFHVAEKALQDPGIAHRVSAETLCNAIKHLFRENILAKERPLTPSLADRIVARAISHIKDQKIITQSHYFPCVLPHDSDSDCFFIGPVAFMTTKSFLESNKQQLSDYTKRTLDLYRAQKKEQIRNARPNFLSGRDSSWPTIDLRKSAEFFEKELREYFEQYPWIARVTAVQFDKNKSLTAGRLCAESAINILKLFLQSHIAKDIRISSSAKIDAKTVQLIGLPDKSFDISLSYHWNNRTEKGWVKRATEGQSGNWLACAGSLIGYLSSGDPIPYLYKRLINALWWYGEGLSQELPHIRIIQLSNALESLLVTKDKFISKQISRRASLLLKINPPSNDWINPKEDWKKRTSDFYNTRSELVHGTLSPFADKVAPQSSWGELIAERVLMEGLSWTLWLAHNNPPSEPRSLHLRFERDLPKFADGTLPDLVP